MNYRPLTDHETANLEIFRQAELDHALVFITATGLKKSILDATQPMRTLLSGNKIHDYSLQGQGPESKKLINAVYVDSVGTREFKSSLYRPRTKQGDPRIWFSGLGKVASPDDILILFVHQEILHFSNLTKLNLAGKSTINYAWGLLNNLIDSNSETADELLVSLREIASNGPIKAVCKGSTAIGRSIESALGIPINSDRAPDFNGIEIKSGRSSVIGRTTRATLFACVPDWDISQCKSSAEILDRFGYRRGDENKLYCTVSAKSVNSQGLQLKVEFVGQILHEISTRTKIQKVAAWRLDRLHEYLLNKHKETFWVKAQSKTINDCEHFFLLSVVHTKNPSLPQFDDLLENGTITLDHLIKRSNKRVNEKGPLFKIERDRVMDLFHSLPKTYSLT